MHLDDLIQPFRIDRLNLHGRFVRLGAVIDQILGRHDYPQPVAVMLGELLALAAALAAGLKFNGVFTIQTNGDGPISMMVADMTNAGALRGYAKFDPERLTEALSIPGPGRPEGGPPGNSVPRLLGAGYLAFTVDQGENMERYQGIVDLDGASLADCLHHYFRQSQQLQSGIRVAVGRRHSDGDRAAWRAGAIVLHRLPHQQSDGDRRNGDLDDAWRDALTLIAGSTGELLLVHHWPADLTVQTIFADHDVRTNAPRSLDVGCRCSRDRVAAVLRAMPRDDIEDLKVDGALLVTCEFCNADYRFGERDLETL